MTNTASAGFKNKTLASFLALSLGGVGAQRFYLYGKKDSLAWLHFASLPVSFALSQIYFGWPGIASYALFLISVLIALVHALVIGLCNDEKWDALHNAKQTRRSQSGWPLALILVFTLGWGAILLIGLIARSFDLLYTGGAYG